MAVVQDFAFMGGSLGMAAGEGFIAAARAAIGQCPPLVARRVVVDVGEDAVPAVVDAAAARQVEHGAVVRRPIDAQRHA